MKKEFGIVLLEKQLDEGLTLSEIGSLFDLLNGCEAIPFEVEAEWSAALGFVNCTDAELMDYDLGPVSAFIRSILEDMDKENSLGEYEFEYAGNIINIHISRDAYGWNKTEEEF